MNLRLSIISAVILSGGLCVAGQTTVETMLADPAKCAGVYLPYPDTQPRQTPVPDGYRPFYVSHYGRHGSRYLANPADYTNASTWFDRASKSGLLTTAGLRVKDIIDRACRDAEGRVGALTPLGKQQHRGIAERLYRQCPEVFASGADIRAISTTVSRCANSMQAFTRRINELQPSLTIPLDSGAHNMHFMSYNNEAAQRFNAPDGPWAKPVADFKRMMTHPARLMNLLFTDPVAARDIVDPSDLMWGLYWIAIDLPNTGAPYTLTDIFTPHELFDLWQVFNYEFYTRNSCNPLNEGKFTDSARNLLSNILDNAEQYIDEGRTGATLRFGHDSTVIPFAGLLQIPVASGRESDPYMLYHTYADYRVSPMGSNIQIRFYRNDAGDILVKFLLNEQEVSIAAPTDIFPYYRWDDVRATFRHMIDNPSFITPNTKH